MNNIPLLRKISSSRLHDITIILCVGYLLCGRIAFAQQKGDCRSLVVKACESLLPSPNQRSLVQELQVVNTTTFRTADGVRPQQTHRQLTWLHQAGQTLLVDGATEMYLAKGLQVAIDHKRKAVLITQPTSTATSTGSNSSDWVKTLRSQLTAMQVMSCKTSSNKTTPTHYVRLQPLADNPLFRQVASVEYTLTGNKPAFLQLTTYYLPNNTISATSMRLISQKWKEQDERLVTPILKQLFDERGRIRPRYRQYSISDYRRR